MKKSDWLKEPATRLLAKYGNQLWTSPATLIELLLVAEEYSLDPERLVIDTLEIAQLRGGGPKVFLTTAAYVKQKGAGVFDSLHAAFCGKESKIISSDAVFDRLGLDRIPLEPKRG